MIHETVQIFGNNVRVGLNVRIDPYCVLSGDIEIGDNVHIACGTYLFGGSGKIRIANYAGISAGCALYTATDDYMGGCLIGPQVPLKYRHVKKGDIILETAAIIGAHCVVLPGVTIGRCARVGAMTLLQRSVEPHTIVAGNPQRSGRLRHRAKLEAILKELGQ